ncbi:MAG: class I SAM-dependent methyltransferase [Polaribacter sp.]
MSQHISYFKHYRKEMLPFIPTTATKILEVGCGQANFSSQLVKEGNEIWGIELNPNAAKVASEKLYKVLTGTIEERISEIPDNYFDVIIMNDVIEHLIYPKEVLEQLKTKMVVNGLIVSSIPNVRYSKNLFKLLFKKDWKYTESGILDNTHFRFFTKKSIKRMFTETGFEVEKCKGINRTESFLYFPFAILFNIILLFSQVDMFFMQFATVARKK